MVVCCGLFSHFNSLQLLFLSHSLFFSGRGESLIMCCVDCAKGRKLIFIEKFLAIFSDAKYPVLATMLRKAYTFMKCRDHNSFFKDRSTFQFQFIFYASAFKVFDLSLPSGGDRVLIKRSDWTHTQCWHVLHSFQCILYCCKKQKQFAIPEIRQITISAV